MRVFQRVVDDGGFAAAARALDLSPATVTRLFGDLEQHLGARLMQRTTRKLALTEAGELYLLRVRSILGEIDDAEAAVGSSTQELQGTVHVLAYAGAGVLLSGAARCALAQAPSQGGAGDRRGPVPAVAGGGV